MVVLGADLEISLNWVGSCPVSLSLSLPSILPLLSPPLTTSFLPADPPLPSLSPLPPPLSHADSGSGGEEYWRRDDEQHDG